MTIGSKYFPLRDWLIYSDKPDEKGCCIAGLKDNAPEDIQSLFREYMALLNNRE